MKAERAMQPKFSIATAAAALALAATIVNFQALLLVLPDREERGTAAVELTFTPVSFDAAAFAPLELRGAWTVTGPDERFGGISGLVAGRDRLLAVTDNGVIVDFAKPTSAGAVARIRELPGGPGSPRRKINRDSEAIAADPYGRGWWIAFENRNALWLYDRDFRRALARAPIPREGLSLNTGIEGMAVAGDALLLFPEAGGRLLRFDRAGWIEQQFGFPARRIADAVALGDGSLLLIERRLTPGGFTNALAKLERRGGGYRIVWRKPLPVGRLDNIEAIAVEPRPDGVLRLWLMSDDNFERPQRTVLIAADLPPDS